MKMPRYRAAFLFAGVLLLAGPVQADEPVRASEYQGFGGSPNDPQIIIRQAESKTIYEYRVNGEIREIKVVPENAPAYYLVPTDGGLERREDSRMRVPSWVIFSW